MKPEINELIGEIETSRSVLAHIETLFANALAGDLTGQNRTLEKAVFLSELFANHYTCLETLFFRISQFFENTLPHDRWHVELLAKMRLRIPGIREPVISDETFRLLDEFRRFRHFKRYYFTMDYDWDRLDFLSKKFSALIPALATDLSGFAGFLSRLQKET